jgi:hypothetical protein
LKTPHAGIWLARGLLHGHMHGELQVIDRDDFHAVF